MGGALEVLFSVLMVGVCSLALIFYNTVWVMPDRIREKLRRQGIRGPEPCFFYGNIRQMKGMKPREKKVEQGHMDHNYVESLFPYFEKWREEYGPIFTYSTGKAQLLYVSKVDLVKEISTCKATHLGKPKYVLQERRALFGHGILASNGSHWAHQRKVIAPEFFLDKVKGMIELMVECTLPFLKTWESRIKAEGGVGDIRVDEDMRTLSADVISRACFGSSYSKGKHIFSKLRAIQHEMSKSGILIGLPGSRYIPTKKNRVMWAKDKEVHSLILKAVKERQESGVASIVEKDLLQVLINEATASNVFKGSNAAAASFIVDNCKNIYFAGHETTATSVAWSLMLLASHKEWQARARQEVMQLCGGQFPAVDTLRNMKILAMVIHETLRLYPPSTFIPREAIQDVKLGGLHIPKDTTIWIPVPTLHRDPQVWGPDAHEFNPGRFSNGLSAASTLPHMYVPFGMGARKCVGQHFAIVEMKIALSLILSRFSFSLSPNYTHSPAFAMVIEPKYGLNLLMTTL